MKNCSSALFQKKAKAFRSWHSAKPTELSLSSISRPIQSLHPHRSSINHSQPSKMAAATSSSKPSGPSPRSLPEEIKLSVTKWEGHWGNKDCYHPRNSLVSGTGQYYLSLSKEERNGKDDWIIFQHQEQEQFIPTAVGIWNYGYAYAIKKIAIEASPNGVEFTPWYDINHIQKQKKEMQRFPISAAKGNIAAKQQYTHYKIRILENYGHWFGCNCFFEFALFGKKGDAMRSYLQQHGMYQI